jgi:hypothetical protein
MKLTTNQLIGINDGSDDNPYMATVGEVVKASASMIVLRDPEFTGTIVAKIAKEDFHRIVLNPCNQDNPYAMPAKISNNMVVAWKG